MKTENRRQMADQLNCQLGEEFECERKKRRLVQSGGELINMNLLGTLVNHVIRFPPGRRSEGLLSKREALVG